MSDWFCGIGADTSGSAVAGRVATAAARLAKVMAPILLAAIVVALCFGATVLVGAIRPPGAAVRSELTAAAAEFRALPPNEKAAAASRILTGYFPAQMQAAVATNAYPASVAVTLQHLDIRACRGLIASARRIEGLVVIELQGYPSPSDCGDDNSMTWSILP